MHSSVCSAHFLLTSHISVLGLWVAQQLDTAPYCLPPLQLYSE